MNIGRGMKAGWQTRCLGEVCEIIMGQSPDGDSYNVTGEGTPLINGPVEFSHGPFGRTIRSKFTTQPTKLCKENDLILCVRGSTTGRMNIAGFDACIGRGVAAIRAKQCQHWINYFIRSKRDDIHALGTGSTFPNVSGAILDGLKVPVPPLPEQQRIVGILDEAFDAIATAKANAEKNLQNARALFESHLQAVFTQRGDGWAEKPLASLCDPMRAITYGVIKLGGEVLDGVPCLRTSNVRWLRIDTEGIKRIAPSLSAEFARTVLRGGEVLVNVRGTLGGVAVTTPEMVGWNISREVAVVPVEPSSVNPEFLTYWIGAGVSQDWLGGVKKGAAYVGINIEDLRLLPVKVPEPAKQLDVVRHLNSLRNETLCLESNYRQKLEGLEALKKSLLRQAFNGEL
jgi:type I restriction enzyme S subunit